MTIGEKIKKIRKVKGISQKKLAYDTELSEISIRKYESGDRKPKIEQLQKIADALGVHISEFLDTMVEDDRIKATWEWIQDNDQKKKELIIEILKTHNYKVEEKDIHWLIVTDHQGFSFYVSREEFKEMILRCDKDIMYNLDKMQKDFGREQN